MQTVRSLLQQLSPGKLEKKHKKISTDTLCRSGLTQCLFFQVNFFNIYPSVAYNQDKVLQSSNKLALVGSYHFIALYTSHKLFFRREISKRPILFYGVEHAWLSRTKLYSMCLFRNVLLQGVYPWGLLIMHLSLKHVGLEKKKENHCHIYTTQ